MLSNHGLLIRVGVAMKEDFWRFSIDVIKEGVEALVRDFIFVVDAARWTVGDKDINLRVIREYWPDFLLGVHDGVWIRFVANAALETGERFAAIVPGGRMKIQNANFFHVLTAAMVAINADFRDMSDLGEWQKVFPGEITE